MKIAKIRTQTNNLLIFDKKYLKLLEKDPNNLNANLKYWQNNNELIALKKGSYIFKSQYNNTQNKNAYLEYLANQLLKPSYLSLEYVLAKYQILSEPNQTLTSLSLKPAREFTNTLGTWRYYSLPKKLFLGYKITYFKNQPVAIAGKAKALFDFLYLRFRRGPRADLRSLENLRLNLENLNKTEKRELKNYFALLPEKHWQEFTKIFMTYVN
jgi:predicted transcriptional regulator of viral defense system